MPGDHEALPTETPNVVIENPRTRKVVYKVFKWVSLAVAVVAGVDLATPAFDLIAWTGPAAVGLGLIGAGIGYTADKNAPTPQ